MLQCFGHLMQKVNSLEKTLMLGKIKGKRRRGWQGMRWLDSITNSMYINLSKLQEIVKDLEDWHAAVLGILKSQTRLKDQTTARKVRAKKYPLKILEKVMGISSSWPAHDPDLVFPSGTRGGSWSHLSSFLHTLTQTIPYYSEASIV